MNKILEFIPIVPYIVIAILALMVIGFAVFVAIRNFVKKAKTAKNVKDVLQAGKEMQDELQDIANNNNLLTIKEYARSLIYSKEALYSKVTNMKTGALKLDSVLTAIEAKCCKLNYEYNEEYWYNYVNTEVSLMKGVK